MLLRYDPKLRLRFVHKLWRSLQLNLPMWAHVTSLTVLDVILKYLFRWDLITIVVSFES